MPEPVPGGVTIGKGAVLVTREHLSGKWFVLHTKSRQEKALADDLAAKGIPHFLPLVSRERLYGRRRAVVEQALFPSYVFLLGELDQLYEADRTRRVANIIHVTDQVRLDWELKNLQLALNQSNTLDPYPELKAGVRVEIRSGPFMGVQGLVESRSSVRRVVLQVCLLGQATSIDVDGAVVDVLGDDSLIVPGNPQHLHPPASRRGY